MTKIKLNQLYIADGGRVCNPGIYEDFELPASLVDAGIAQVVVSETERLANIAKLKAQLEQLEAVKGVEEPVLPEPVVQQTVTIEVQKEPETAESPVEEVVEGEVTKPGRKRV